MSKKPIEIDGGCKFFSDLQSNNNVPNLAIWNLLVSIRDLKLSTKGIKPHRNWKISDVKKYFGMNGSAKVLLSNLKTLKEVTLSEVELNEMEDK
jgi:hypothetical protein